jgi:LysR family nod box-dependent transcriptional activator
MILTPKAEELAQPVRQALTLIRSKVIKPMQFQPETAERNFLIAATDYVFHVLLVAALARASKEAPNVTFEILSMDRFATERMERGEIDLVITLGKFMHPHHPRAFLFEDEHAVICWSESTYSKSFDAEQFYKAGHAVACFGVDRHPAFTDTYFAEHNVDRKIELRLPSFAAFPNAVIGTQRVATMYRRHAEYFARMLPISVLPMPFPMPNVQEEAQWHSMRSKDEGLQWLLGLLQGEAEQLRQSTAARALKSDCNTDQTNRFPQPIGST